MPAVKPYWLLYRQNLVSSRLFLSLLLGGGGAIVALGCWQLPGARGLQKVLYVLAGWGTWGLLLFGLTLLAVWVDVSEAPGAARTRRSASVPRTRQNEQPPPGGWAQ